VDDDPYAFVADKNLHRRHLSPSQLGLIGAKMATLSIGNPNLKSPIGGQQPIGVSQGQAATILNVGRSTVRDAMKARVENGPEVPLLAGASSFRNKEGKALVGALTLWHDRSIFRPELLSKNA